MYRENDSSTRGFLNMFFCAVLVDAESGRCDVVKDIRKDGKPLFGCVTDGDTLQHLYLHECVVESDREKMKAFFDPSKVTGKLCEKPSMSVVYRSLYPVTEWCRACWIVTETSENGVPRKALFALEDVGDMAKDYLKESMPVHDRVGERKTILIVEDNELTTRNDGCAFRGSI